MIRTEYIEKMMKPRWQDILRSMVDQSFAVDVTGRRYRDSLTRFMRWYFRKGPSIPFSPLVDGQHFVEGVTGVVLFRSGSYQVQLFVAAPGCYIPPHVHPNVDSYEVSIRGMEFYHEGQTILNLYEAFLGRPQDDAPLSQGGFIRVKPNEKHGALASPEGGVFLSVQQWLNGVPPSSVGNDWEGKTMGDEHSRQASK